MYEAGGHLWRPGKVQLMAHDAAMRAIPQRPPRYSMKSIDRCKR